MKIRLKYKINFDEANKLIERYYEGLTSGEEEKELQQFLSQPGLPERYEPEQALFGYFNQKKKKAPISLVFYKRWASVAAVVVLVLVGSQMFFIRNQQNYAYVDGKKISNVHEIRSQALASLSDISSSANEVEEGFKNINDNELVKQQLDVFSGLEK